MKAIVVFYEKGWSDELVLEPPKSVMTKKELDKIRKVLDAGDNWIGKVCLPEPEWEESKLIAALSEALRKLLEEAELLTEYDKLAKIVTEVRGAERLEPILQGDDLDIFGLGFTFSAFMAESPNGRYIEYMEEWDE